MARPARVGTRAGKTPTTLTQHRHAFLLLTLLIPSPYQPAAQQPRRTGSSTCTLRSDQFCKAVGQSARPLRNRAKRPLGGTLERVRRENHMTINPTDLSALSSTGKTDSATNDKANQPRKDVDANMFLTLLIAQLKNQDPLEPQQGAEFVAQLAQFNSLEQLTSINDRINQLLNLQKPQTETQKAALGIVPLPVA